MAIIVRNRVLRLSTRLSTSISYKISTEKVSKQDKLIVRVYSEQESLMAEFYFDGHNIAPQKSIHFRYVNDRISWGKYDTLIAKKTIYPLK